MGHRLPQPLLLPGESLTTGTDWLLDQRSKKVYGLHQSLSLETLPLKITKSVSPTQWLQGCTWWSRKNSCLMDDKAEMEDQAEMVKVKMLRIPE